MKLANLLLLCSLVACSSTPSQDVAPSPPEPSPAMGRTSPKVAATAQRSPSPSAEPVEPTLAATQPAAGYPAEDPVAPPGPAAANSCGFSALERFAGRTLKWEGECVAGKAHGKGALRAYPKAGSADKAVLIFFGVLERGDATLGVIDTPDGFMAGEFDGGKLLDSESRDVTIRAFRVAAEAASLVSERMKTAGNATSASFYAKKAQSLEQQMD